MKITKTHRTNCIKLMLGALETPPPELRMQAFCTVNKTPARPYMLLAHQKENPNLCGTTCCFLGMGPTVGIGAKSKKLQIPGYCWDDYSKDFFGLTRDGSGQDIENWSFVFGSHWFSEVKQCAARMRYYLTKGVPKASTCLCEYPELTERAIKHWKKELYN